MVLDDSTLSPHTYGVYRVSNSVFLRELAALSKVDVVYKRFLETPSLKLKDILSNFIKSKDGNKTEIEKIGMFKKIYARITNISPRTVAIGGLGVVGVGVGTNAFFTIKDPIVTETQLNDGTVFHPELEREHEATKETVDEENELYNQTIDEILDQLIET